MVIFLKLKMKVTLATNKITKPYLYNDTQQLKFTPCPENEEDDIVSLVYCNDLRDLFQEKTGQNINNFWFNVKPFISSKSFKVCDHLGIFHHLKEVLANSETKWESIHLEVLIKVGTTETPTVIKSKSESIFFKVIHLY